MIYLLLADGFEEIEALTPLDLLRRAGKQVITAGIGKREITGAHDIKIIADIEASEIKLDENIEMLILPGGMPGTENLFASEKVKETVEYCYNNNIYISAICAAPIILGRLNLLQGKEAVCYPGYEQELKGAVISKESVAQDGRIITAKGAGVSVQFAIKLVEIFCGTEKAAELSKALQCS
ncbi:MAG: DJ-1/PfpI family protein [Oscillospiraceae bacterium]|nr:DJ-1/PfpI family protein [Oscillospiraceae bacterium]